MHVRYRTQIYNHISSMCVRLCVNTKIERVHCVGDVRSQDGANLFERGVFCVWVVLMSAHVI